MNGRGLRFVKIEDNLKSPNHIGISSFVYNNLNDEVKYHTKKDKWGNETKVDIWTQGYFTYNDKTEIYYYTNYWWTIG